MGDHVLWACGEIGNLEIHKMADPITIPVEVTYQVAPAAAEATSGGLGFGELTLVLMGIAVVTLFVFYVMNQSKQHTAEALRTYDFRDNANDKIRALERDLDNAKRTS